MKKEYLDKLASALCAHMPEETVLVCATRSEGKRILSALAAQGRILVGVRAETPFSLARELCSARLSAPGAAPLLQENDGAELVRSCIDKNSGIYIGVNAKTLTATKEIFRAFQELSMADFPENTEQLPAVKASGKLQELMSLRKAYLNKKQAWNRMDRGDLFRMALTEAENHHPLTRAHYVALGDYAPAPLERNLLDKLAAKNGLTLVEISCAEGTTLPADALAAELPRVNVQQLLRDAAPRFAACRGRETEVRYVLRDILAQQWKLEDCAVVYLNGSYAQPLYEEAARFGMNVTLGSGLPLKGSLLYNTLKQVEAWRQNDFYAEDLCALLESFSCGPLWPAKLAERLRQKKIGWGKARYALACEADVEKMRAQNMTDDAWEATLASWKEFLHLAVAAAAPTADLEQQKKDLAAFLTFCNHSSAAEAAAYSKAQELIGQIVGLDTRETALQRLLSLMETSAYLSSKPRAGALHCAPVSGASCLNRPHVYIIGFARYAVEGTHKESPILLDEERIALGGLKTSAQLRDEQEFRLLTWLSRCGSDLVLTYPDFDSDKMLELRPAPLFEEVSRGRPVEKVTYIPTGTHTAADKLLQEEKLAAFSKAKTKPLPAGDTATLQDQKLRKELLEEMLLSPSALESALKCPYAFYLEKFLHIRTPQAVERNNMQWLAANEIGTFCHGVLEAYYTPGQTESWEAIFEREFEKLEQEVPLPRRRLKAEAKETLRGMVQRAVEWTANSGRTVVMTEKHFPEEGQESLPMTFGQWTLKMRGSIDRVDRLSSGDYAILDYKTGRAENYTEELHRHWQHYLYTVAEEQLSGKKDSIRHASYLFLKNEAVLEELTEDADLREETAARVEWLLNRISDEDYEPETAPDFRPETVAPGAAVPKPRLLEPGDSKAAVERCKQYCEFADICPAVNKKGGL